MENWVAPATFWLLEHLMSEMERLFPIPVRPYAVASVRHARWNVYTERFEVPRMAKLVDVAEVDEVNNGMREDALREQRRRTERRRQWLLCLSIAILAIEQVTDSSQ